MINGGKISVHRVIATTLLYIFMKNKVILDSVCFTRNCTLA